MKPNLDDLESKAMAEQDADRAAMQAVADGIDVAEQRASWHRRDAARAVLRSEMTPSVVLALITRIRELEAKLTEVADELALSSEDPDETADIRALVAKGAVLP